MVLVFLYRFVYRVVTKPLNCNCSGQLKSSLMSICSDFWSEYCCSWITEASRFHSYFLVGIITAWKNFKRKLTYWQKFYLLVAQSSVCCGRQKIELEAFKFTTQNQLGFVVIWKHVIWENWKLETWHVRVPIKDLPESNLFGYYIFAAAFPGNCNFWLPVCYVVQLSIRLFRPNQSDTTKFKLEMGEIAVACNENGFE